MYILTYCYYMPDITSGACLYIIMSYIHQYIDSPDDDDDDDDDDSSSFVKDMIKVAKQDPQDLPPPVCAQ